MKESNNKIFLNLLVGLLCIITIIMVVVYFTSFGSNGVSKKTEDFAYFGSYFSSVLNMLTILILVLTLFSQNSTNRKVINSAENSNELQQTSIKEQLRANNELIEIAENSNILQSKSFKEQAIINRELLEKSIENNKLQSENLEKEILINRRNELLSKINNLKDTMNLTLNEKVYPAEFYDVQLEYDFLNSPKVFNSKEEFELSFENRREVSISLLIASIESCLKSKGKIDYKELRKVLLEDIVNIGYKIINLGNSFEHLVILSNELSKYDSNLIDVTSTLSEYQYIINILHKIGVVRDVAYEYSNSLISTGQILPTNIIEVRLMEFKDVKEWTMALTENKYTDAEMRLFRIRVENEKGYLLNKDGNLIKPFELAQLSK